MPKSGLWQTQVTPPADRQINFSLYNQPERTVLSLLEPGLSQLAGLDSTRSHTVATLRSFST